MDVDYLQTLSHTDDGSTVLRHLMQSFGQDVWNYAFFLTKQADAADDISQDVFLQAYTHLSTFRGQSSVKTWLLTITRNKAFNYNKSAYVRRILLIDRFQSPKATSRSAENELFDKLETRHIWCCVMKLPSKFREPLILDAHYQMTMLEIADMLNIRVGTVKSRISRAKAKLVILIKQFDETANSFAQEV